MKFCNISWAIIFCRTPLSKCSWNILIWFGSLCWYTISNSPVTCVTLTQSTYNYDVSLSPFDLLTSCCNSYNCPNWSCDRKSTCPSSRFCPIIKPSVISWFSIVSQYFWKRNKTSITILKTTTLKINIMKAIQRASMLED